MRRALEEYRIVGVRTNIPFHQTLMDSHRFMGGHTIPVSWRSVSLIQEERDPALMEIAAALATLAATGGPNAPRSSSSASARAIPPTGSGWDAGSECTGDSENREPVEAAMKYVTTIEDKEYRVEIVDEKHIRINDQLLEVDLVAVGGQPVYSLLDWRQILRGLIYPEEKEWRVLLRGQQYKATVEDEREKRLKSTGGARAESGEFHLKAPMPGLVVSVPVEEGQAVKKGQVLVILESMKMQNELKSPRDGTVHRIRVRAKGGVEQRQTLLSVM